MLERPQARNDLQVVMRGDEALLEDPLHGKVHVLNETACYIWTMCDGKHTLDDIALQVRAAFDVPPEIDVRHDVQRTLQALARRDLFVNPQH